MCTRKVLLFSFAKLTQLQVTNLKNRVKNYTQRNLCRSLFAKLFNDMLLLCSETAPRQKRSNECCLFFANVFFFLGSVQFTIHRMVGKIFLQAAPKPETRRVDPEAPGWNSWAELSAAELVIPGVDLVWKWKRKKSVKESVSLVETVSWIHLAAGLIEICNVQSPKIRQPSVEGFAYALLCAICWQIQFYFSLKTKNPNPKTKSNTKKVQPSRSSNFTVPGGVDALFARVWLSWTPRVCAGRPINGSGFERATFDELAAWRAVAVAANYFGSVRLKLVLVCWKQPHSSQVLLGKGFWFCECKNKLVDLWKEGYWMERCFSKLFQMPI